MDACWRHRDRRCGGRTPRRHRREGPRLQALHAQPEAAVLPHHRLQLPPIPAEEDEAVAGVRVMPQVVLHHARQQVDTSTHILVLARQENAANRCEVQHRRRRHASAVDRRRPARSAGRPAVNVHRRPLRVVIVNGRRRRRCRDGRTTSSMKAEGMPSSCQDYWRTRSGCRTDTLHGDFREITRGPLRHLSRLYISD